MEEAFGYVIFAVVAISAVVAVIAASGTDQVYRQIGRGGLSLNDGSDRPAREVTTVVAAQEREDEIRQMLAAKNARRARRGEAPLDIEAELASLTRPVIDAGLLGEIRDLVEARNARRLRAGKEPLDVEDEVARQLRELT